MKKNIIVSIIVVLMLIGTVGTNIAIAATATIGVTNEGVNFRAEPNTDSKIIDRIGWGSEMEILEESGDWYRASFNGNTGYVYKEYIDIKTWGDNAETLSESPSFNADSVENVEEEITESEEIEEEEDAVEVEEEQEEEEETDELIDQNWTALETTADTSLRVSPNFSSRVKSTISAGSTVTVVNELNNWVKVTDGNVTGWAVKQNIK